LIVDITPSCSRLWPAALKIVFYQRRMRQWVCQIVNIGVGLVVEQYDQLRGSKPPKLRELILEPVIEHPVIDRKIDLSSRFGVCQQPVAIDSGTVTQHRAEFSRRSFQAAHGCVCELGLVNVHMDKDLQCLPDAFDARAGLVGVKGIGFPPWG